MHHFWNITAILLGAVHAFAVHAQTPSVFSHAQINVPFEVKRVGTWVEVIETREAWHAFYVANAKVYLGPNSDRLTPPEFDFAAYQAVEKFSELSLSCACGHMNENPLALVLLM